MSADLRRASIVAQRPATVFRPGIWIREHLTAQVRCFFFLGGAMKVVVQDNQIERAIRDLKRKLTKEGFFSEIKERRFYDKPSVQRKKKQAKAAKRRRKRMRKF
jgi:small subunit ribosomal protein S21